VAAGVLPDSGFLSKPEMIGRDNSIMDNQNVIATQTIGGGVDGQQTMQAETYVVCVQCGRHFAYDWSTMRTIEQRPTGGDGVQTLLAEP
jgi:hypothetical protein